MPSETMEPPVEAPSDAFAEADAGLDAIVGTNESGQLEAPVAAPLAAPAKSPAPATPAAPPKQPEVESEDDIPTAPKAKPVEPKPETKPDPKGKKGESLSEFRKEYETTKAERDQLKAEIAATKVEREKLLDEGRKAAAKEFQAKIDEREKQLADMDVELRYTKYERSKEYKDKFEVPLDTAWRKALTAIKGIKLLDASGNEREAGFDDIYALTKMEEIPAAQRAHELFGVAASAVMKHRDRIMELEEGRTSALREYREKGSEREAAQAKEREAAEEEKIQIFQQFADSEKTSKSEFFADDPADEAGNKWLKAGIKLARKAMFGEGIPDGLTPKERILKRVEAQAMMYNRAAAYGREVHRRQMLEAKVASLSEKLAKFEKSEPEPAAPKDHSSSGEEGDIDHEFNKHFGV